LWDRILNLIGFEEVAVADDYDEEETGDHPGGGRMPRGDRFRDEAADSSREKRAHRGQVVSIQGGRPVRVVVTEPASFEDVQLIVDHLKSRRPVLVNLEFLEKPLMRRVIDFVSGAVYSLDGHMQQVGSGVMLFTPREVEIASMPGRSGTDFSVPPDDKEGY